MDKIQGVEALLESRIGTGNRVGFPACFKGLDVVSKVPVKIGKCQGHAFSVADGDARGTIGFGVQSFRTAFQDPGRFS